jgi:hypothetical protein
MVVMTIADAHGISRGRGLVRVTTENVHSQKKSRYLEAGSPLACFLPSCRSPFLDRCVHANDGHFYCSAACAEEGSRLDLSHVQAMRF